MLALALVAGCGQPDVLYVGAAASDPLPATWTEHWFEHDQTLGLAASDDTVALYFDADMDPASATWALPFFSQSWKYTTRTYGSMGPGRLYLIFHKGRYLGCHIANHFSPSHDNRNVIDCGFSSWDDLSWLRFQISHMAANLVEDTSAGRSGSPALGLWGDSKWAEFYQYDLYRGVGMQAESDAHYAVWVSDGWTDTFPVMGTHWFRDWFFPLWRDDGGPAVMTRFFALLAQHFPHMGTSYARDMNWGEFVHFMSAAAHRDLQPQAAAAFGWPAEWQAQLTAAHASFPQLSY
jgi:hypothetical protein